MFKLLKNLIVIAIIFALIIGCFFLLINKTFIYDTYTGDLMDGDGISINRFMYLVKEDSGLNTRFATFLTSNKIKESKENYLKDLEECYGVYYYDNVNNITITKYNIIDNQYYRDVYISYASGNYCSDDYVLSDKWIYEYKNLSKYLGGDISSNAMNSFVEKVYESNRVDNPIISDYNNNVSLNIDCSIDGVEYKLVLEDFSDGEIVVKKIMNGITQFGVYEVDNALEYLNELVNS